MATGRRNIAVHDGTVTGFETGIGLQSTTDATVRNVRAFSNGFVGIFVGSGAVTGNTAGDNNDGIRTGSGSTVAGNMASANIVVGIRVGNSSTVTGNTASGGDGGISVGNNSTVSGNTASSANDFGVLVGSGSTVAGNTASNNDRFGLSVNCPSNVFDNTAVGANEVNLRLVSPAACNVVNNLAP